MDLHTLTDDELRQRRDDMEHAARLEDYRHGQTAYYTRCRRDQSDCERELERRLPTPARQCLEFGKMLTGENDDAA